MKCPRCGSSMPGDSCEPCRIVDKVTHHIEIAAEIEPKNHNTIKREN